MITNTHQSFGSLLDWILSAFNQHEAGLNQVEMHQKLMDYLIGEYAKNKKVLLIVDEAQNMKPETLEELRMLSNVNSEKDQIMQVILAGQPALKEALRIPELMQFAQRIGVDYHLDELDAHETCGYIQHRLVVAGATKDIFTPAACLRIHRYSGGTPRLINLLCDTVMVYGFADQQSQIDVALVEEMVQERMKDSVVPLMNREKPAESELSVEDIEQDFPWIEARDGAAGLAAELSADNSADAAVAPQDDGPAGAAAAGSTLPDEEAESSSGNIAAEPVDVPDIAATESGTAGKKAVINTVEVVQPEEEEPSGSRWGIYLAIAAVVLLVFFFLFQTEALKSVFPDQQAEIDKALAQEKQRQLQAQQAHEAEQKRLKQQAEKLQRERDEAMAKIAAEKKRAEKAAAEVAAALKAAEKAKRDEAEKQAAAAREKERLAKKKAERDRQRALEKEKRARLAAQKAEAEAAAAKKKAEELAEQKRQLEARLAEERRLKELEETRRLEEEWRQKQLQAIQASEAAAVTETTPVVSEKKTEKKLDASCTGPAARFKSHCR
ncbi:MAG TPA: hypothetical protein ENJ64_00515 [Thiotrichales bacterium]|nr:hypothetical protein [Thiotrichales bacterium]